VRHEVSDLRRLVTVWVTPEVRASACVARGEAVALDVPSASAPIAAATTVNIRARWYGGVIVFLREKVRGDEYRQSLVQNVQNLIAHNA
jgi:hypothetical protein